MKRANQVSCLMTALLIAMTGLCMAATKSAPAKNVKVVTATTLDNLMAAYNDESNAKAKYEAYAKKAQEEGYLKVAHLFRAVAVSEGIHAANHAKVIGKLGSIPKTDIKASKVGTTKNNLKDAIAGETWEFTNMYPGFIQVATTEQQSKAIKTFNLAVLAEKGHAKLYADALADLNGWKADGTFFVCQVCGNAVEKINFSKCPVCFESKREYKEVK